MPTAKDVLATARKELGYVENPKGSNKTKFGKQYGMDGVAWCLIFLWCCFQNTKGAGKLIPKTGYTPTLADWARAQGKWGTSPRAGALALFDFPGDGVNRISHVGIVEAINKDGSIITIEGNTDEAGGRTGGKVMRKTRKTGVVGYYYPAYDGPSTTNTPAPVAKYPTLKTGSTGTHVALIQRFLGLLPADGIFGPKTKAEVERYQRMQGLTADGVVGPATWAKTRL